MNCFYFIRIVAIIGIIASPHYVKSFSSRLKKMAFGASCFGVGYLANSAQNRINTADEKKRTETVPLGTVTIPFTADIKDFNGVTGNVSINATLGTFNNMEIYPKNLSPADLSALIRQTFEKQTKNSSPNNPPESNSLPNNPPERTDAPIRVIGQIPIIVQRDSKGTVTVGVDNRTRIVSAIEVDPHRTGQIIQTALPGVAHRQLRYALDRMRLF